MAPSLRIASRFALALACACTALALQAFAQDGRLASSTPEQRARKQTELMKETLALTDEQLPKVEAINLDAAKKFQAVFASADRRGKKLRAAKQIQDEKATALKGVLTPEQFEQYLAAREEIAQKVEERAREKRAEGGQAP